MVVAYTLVEINKDSKVVSKDFKTYETIIDARKEAYKILKNKPMGYGIGVIRISITKKLYNAFADGKLNSKAAAKDTSSLEGMCGMRMGVFGPLPIYKTANGKKIMYHLNKDGTLGGKW